MHPRFMLTYQKLSKKPKRFRSFTGLDVEQFDFLSKKVEAEYEKTEIERLAARKRKRRIGAGRNFKMPVRDRLLMSLVYWRLYTTYELTGYLFGIDTSNAYRDIKYLEHAVKRCVPIPGKIYAKAKRISTLEELEEYFPGLKVFIDASEQEIPRPKEKRKRRTHYSGKKKKHTVKNQYAGNLRGEIIYKPPHSPGRPHDYSILKKKRPVLPKGLQTFIDLGYKGMEKDFPEMNPVLPHKKKKGVKLTPVQKEFNRKHSSVRVAIEHTISKIKKFRIMGNIFRNRLKRYDTISDIICGIVNFRIRYLYSLVVAP